MKILPWITIIVVFAVVMIGGMAMSNAFRDAQGEAVNQTTDLTGVIITEAHNASSNLTNTVFQVGGTLNYIFVAFVIMIIVVGAVASYYAIRR
jgi:uncharacterized MAPEG superfamily protein